MNILDNKLKELGLSKLDRSRIKIYKNLRPKDNMCGLKLGTLKIIKPVGLINKNMVWLCRCECGKKILKTRFYIRNSKLPNCGCKDKSGEAYEFWKKIKNKCGNSWLNFIKFRDECYTYRSDKKFLCRKDITKSLNNNNFFWSDCHEKYHTNINKVANILVRLEGYTRKNAIERVILMSKEERAKLVLKELKSNPKPSDIKFLEKYNKNSIESIRIKMASISISPKAIIDLGKILEDYKYDEPTFDLLINKEDIRAKFAKLPRPIKWNPEKEEWDL